MLNLIFSIKHLGVSYVFSEDSMQSATWIYRFHMLGFAQCVNMYVHVHICTYVYMYTEMCKYCICTDIMYRLFYLCMYMLV